MIKIINCKNNNKYKNILTKIVSSYSEKKSEKERRVSTRYALAGTKLQRGTGWKINREAEHNVNKCKK